MTLIAELPPPPNSLLRVHPTSIIFLQNKKKNYRLLYYLSNKCYVYVAVICQKGS